ncbi:MAG: HD domain-containing protein [Desulfuromonadaceae bacterium]|nr:HD domain-containing protein [Desulfuromonadaceae bacterium]
MNTSIQDFLHSFNAYYRGLRLYPSQHPSSRQLAERYWEALQHLLKLRREVKVGIIDDTLFINEKLCSSSSPAALSLLALLQEIDLDGFEILGFIQKPQALKFIELLHNGSFKGPDFETTLQRHGIDTIRALNGSDKEGDSTCRKVYANAIQAMAETCAMVENDETPSSCKLFETAESITTELTRTPYAFMALTMIKDYDDYTFCHSVNVAVFAIAIGRACNMTHDDLQILGTGSLMHDLGKLRIDPAIVKKPGPLSPREFEAIKKHPDLGVEIANRMDDISPGIIDIIRCHHLHYDRCGYPQIQLNSNTAPFVDIATVADTYDAITTLRAYRQPSTPALAVRLLQQLAGTQLNPEYVKVLSDILGRYPVGSLVRLVNNEIGLIVDADTHNPLKSTIRILRDSEGNMLNTPSLKQLEVEGTHIAGEVDPVLHNININEWF